MIIHWSSRAFRQYPRYAGFFHSAVFVVSTETVAAPTVTRRRARGGLVVNPGRLLVR